jgi:outer membrane protein TolC
VARARAANREALLAYRQAMLRATEEVENALLTSVYLDEERAALLEQVDAAGRARAQAHEAWLGGAASLVDELELDRDYLAARDRLSQAETDAARARMPHRAWHVFAQRYGGRHIRGSTGGGAVLASSQSKAKEQP